MSRLPLRSVLLRACLLGLLALAGPMSRAAAPEAPAAGPRMLIGASAVTLPPAAIVAGQADAALVPYSFYVARRTHAPFWVRLDIAAPAAETSALTVRRGRHLPLRVYLEGDVAAQLPLAIRRSSFRGTLEESFVVPPTATGRALYVQVQPQGQGAEDLAFMQGSLPERLDAGVGQSRVFAAAFGALIAMSIVAFLIWFLIPDRLFLLYFTLFSLQALYIAYLSGQGFDWPLLSAALPLLEHTWNVTAALSGAAACLFVREIADLRRYSPRVYTVYGWLALAFVLLAASNGLEALGAGALVADIGNLMFVGTAVFTLIVAFLAWRRGSRAAGWFLVAWTLLETMTIATAISFLLSDDEPQMLYVALPLSMVAAAILVALGVADRVREQRAALGEAERRAQLDPLTGVLNRRSLLERLDAACQRAQARGLPISLLFIDLDHFKSINDSHGHLAGDACLRAVVAPIQAELRQSDVIGRYGGEEFVVILSSADLAAAQATADRIRARVEELRVDGYGAPIALTCSIGIAASDAHGVWGEPLIARADAAVYAAKRAGRNQVRAAEAVA